MEWQNTGGMAARTFRYLVTLLLAMAVAPGALAVVVVEVSERDVPTMHSATISFTDVEGETRDARLEVQGGRTVVVIDGTTDQVRGGELNVRPSDGTPRFSPVIPMDWDGRTALELDARRQQITQAPADGSRQDDFYSGPSWTFIFSAGKGKQDIAEWGPAAGVALAPGDERRLLTVDRKRDIDEQALEVWTPPLGTAGWMGGVRAGFSYTRSQGDDDGRAEVPIGTDNVFGVFDGVHPTLGTGLFGGPSGIASTYDYDLDGDRFDIGLRWQCDSAVMGATVRPQFGVFWGEDDVDFRSYDEFSAFSNLSILTRRTIKSDYWGAQLGADISKPLGGGFSFELGAGVIYQDRDSKLESLAQIDLLGMPEMLEVRTRDSDSDVGGYAHVGIGYEFNQHVKVDLRYRLVEGVGNLGGTGPVDGDDVLAGQEARPTTTNGDDMFNLLFTFAF